MKPSGLWWWFISLIAIAILVGALVVAARPQQTPVERWYIEDGSICHEVFSGDPRLGSALTCQKLDIP